MRVLVIEDDPDMASVLRRPVRAGDEGHVATGDGSRGAGDPGRGHRPVARRPPGSTDRSYATGRENGTTLLVLFFFAAWPHTRRFDKRSFSE